MFVRKKGRKQQSFLERILNTVVLIGSFSKWSSAIGNRLKFVVSEEIGGRVPKGEVFLDADRIVSVFKKDDKYYIAYDTENVDFYMNYLARLPEGATEEKELKEVVGCVVPKNLVTGEGEQVIYDPDICWDYYVAGDFIRWIYATRWAKKREAPIEIQGEPKLTEVTERNLRYLAERYFSQKGIPKENLRGTSRNIHIHFIEKQEEEKQFDGIPIKVIRGLGFTRSTFYDEPTYEYDFGWYECITSDELYTMECVFEKNPEVVKKVAESDYNLFIRRIDELKEAYGNEVLNYVVWKDESAPYLIEKFPERFKDKLNEIASKAADLILKNPSAYEESNPELEKYYFSYPYTWIDIALYYKNYLEPDVLEKIEEAKRAVEEWKAEEKRRKEEERRREEEEKKRKIQEKIEELNKELADWSRYIELQSSDETIVVSTKRFMSRDLFNELISKLKKLGFKFNYREKRWEYSVHSVSTDVFSMLESLA